MTGEKHFIRKNAFELLAVDSLVRADSYHEVNGNPHPHKHVEDWWVFTLR